MGGVSSSGKPSGQVGSMTSGATSTSGGVGTSSGSGGLGAGGSEGSGAGGMSQGGTSSGGAGGTGQGGAGGTGQGGAGGNNAECTRQLLQNTVDAYFEALAAHDPSTLPLADDVKFTENGEVVELGEMGMWTTAGALVYSQTALDTMECMSVSQAVVPDGAMDIPFALRLKLESQKITEIETIRVRPGDYSVASDTQALMASAGSVHWEDPVPADQQNSREEIFNWMDKYYRVFPNGVCNTSGDCTRIENGGGSFSCSAGASCSAGPPGAGQAALNPRLILVDTERGLGIGFTMFQGTYTDTHMFKMYGGQVYGVSAILASADSSGWD